MAEGLLHGKAQVPPAKPFQPCTQPRVPGPSKTPLLPTSLLSPKIQRRRRTPGGPASRGLHAEHGHTWQRSQEPAPAVGFH